MSSPIRIAFHGFNTQEEYQALNDLFARSSYWEQPWQVVDEIDQAEFVLLATNCSEDSTAPCHDIHCRFEHKNLIAYAEKPCKVAQWRLSRNTNSHTPSSLEFASLLKNITEYRKKHLELLHSNSASLSTASHQHHSENIKILIIGSIGSGKTSAVQMLADNCIATEAMPSDHTQLHKNTTTVAMDYGYFDLNDKTIHIYGAPGQRRFDFMSDILIKNAHGLVILVSNKDSNPLNELNYYLNNNEAFLSHHPVVIGVTHNDLNPVPSLNDYRNFIAKRNPDWPVVKIDARERNDLLSLIDILIEKITTPIEL